MSKCCQLVAAPATQQGAWCCRTRGGGRGASLHRRAPGATRNASSCAGPAGPQVRRPLSTALIVVCLLLYSCPGSGAKLLDPSPNLPPARGPGSLSAPQPSPAASHEYNQAPGARAAPLGPGSGRRPQRRARSSGRRALLRRARGHAQAAGPLRPQAPLRSRRLIGTEALRSCQRQAQGGGGALAAAAAALGRALLAAGNCSGRWLRQQLSRSWPC